MAEMTSRVELITPDLARQILAHNTNNRNVRKSVVSRYAHDMAEGKWAVTHQGIAIAQDETLLDGQHRLLAVITANRPTYMMVTRNIPVTETLYVCDTSAKRTFTDIAVMNGKDDLYASKIVPPIVRTIFRFCLSTLKPTYDQIYNFITDNYEDLDWVKRHSIRNGVGYSHSLISAVALLAINAGEDEEDVDAFLRCVNANEIDSRYNCQAALNFKDVMAKHRGMSGAHLKDVFIYGQAACHAFIHNSARVYKEKIYYKWNLKKEDN